MVFVSGVEGKLNWGLCTHSVCRAKINKNIEQSDANMDFKIIAVHLYFWVGGWWGKRGSSSGRSLPRGRPPNKQTNKQKKKVIHTHTEVKFHPHPKPKVQRYHESRLRARTSNFVSVVCFFVLFCCVDDKTQGTDTSHVMFHHKKPPRNRFNGAHRGYRRGA
jgi:hypothetical protein